MIRNLPLPYSSPHTHVSSYKSRWTTGIHSGCRNFNLLDLSLSFGKYSGKSGQIIHIIPKSTLLIILYRTDYILLKRRSCAAATRPLAAVIHSCADTLPALCAATTRHTIGQRHSQLANWLSHTGTQLLWTVTQKRLVPRKLDLIEQGPLLSARFSSPSYKADPS